VFALHAPCTCAFSLFLSNDSLFTNTLYGFFILTSEERKIEALDISGMGRNGTELGWDGNTPLGLDDLRHLYHFNGKYMIYLPLGVVVPSALVPASH
jgi:hypothetical protein